jgi:hypothetical protein
MAAPAKLDVTILQGATFQYVFRWEALPFIYKDISAITKDAPVSITAATHGIPDGWRVAISNVKGMKQINALKTPPALSDFRKVTVVDPNTITINEINSTDYTAYQSSGVLHYYTPVDLGGYTARMKIKRTVKDTASLVELTTANAKIVLDNVAKTISLLISATDTALLTFTSGVYDLELVSAGSVVTRLVEGNVTVSKEVTA